MLALIRGDGSQISISEQKFHQWQADYPGLNVRDEVIKANAWMARNKSKSWKTIGGFEAWLKRAHESSPRVAADKKSSGQLAYRERVQREENERQAAEAAIPRPSAEKVTETCAALLRSLPEYIKPEPNRLDWRKCDQHIWSRSFYTGGQWCSKCGLHQDQLGMIYESYLR